MSVDDLFDEEDPHRSRGKRRFGGGDDDIESVNYAKRVKIEGPVDVRTYRQGGGSRQPPSFDRRYERNDYDSARVHDDLVYGRLERRDRERRERDASRYHG